MKTYFILLLTIICCGISKTSRINSVNLNGEITYSEDLTPDNPSTNSDNSKNLTLKNKINTDQYQDQETGLSRIEVNRLVSQNVGFQVKTPELLNSAIKSCFGDKKTLIKDTMFMKTFKNTSGNLVVTAANGTVLTDSKSIANRINEVNKLNQTPDKDGRVKFLDPSEYKAGDDIIQKNLTKIRGILKGTRLSSYNDRITELYLLTLSLIADVVIHNCELSDPLCNCTTSDSALAIAQKCFPYLESTSDDLKLAATDISTSCQTTDKYAQRRALASIIGSLAFAYAR